MQINTVHLTLKSADEQQLSLAELLALFRSRPVSRNFASPPQHVGAAAFTVVANVRVEGRVTFAPDAGDAAVLQLVGRDGTVFFRFERSIDVGGVQVQSPLFMVPEGELAVSEVVARGELDEDPAILEWTTVKALQTGETLNLGGREVSLVDEVVVTHRREATDKLKLRVLLLKGGEIVEVAESPVETVPGAVAAISPFTIA